VPSEDARPRGGPARNAFRAAPRAPRGIFSSTVRPIAMHRLAALLALTLISGAALRADAPAAKAPPAAPTAPAAPIAGPQAAAAEAATGKLALEGFDAVSFQKDAEPVRGVSDHALEWEGLVWYFATDANRAAFMKDPGAFAPQYEGDCACVVATEGKRVAGDPQIFRVMEGKLYLFRDQEKRSIWDKHPSEFIRKGNEKALTLYRVRF